MGCFCAAEAFHPNLGLHRHRLLDERPLCRREYGIRPKKQKQMTIARSLHALPDIHRRANQLFKNRQFSEAFSLLKEALEQYPEEPRETLKKLMACCISLGSLNQGYTYGRQLVELGVKDVSVMQGMALFARQLGYKTEALEWQATLAQGSPTENRAQLLYAYSLRDAGQLDKAWKLFRTIELVDPDFADARYQRIFAGRRLCQWDTWDADVQWLRSRLSDPNCHSVNPYLAITYEEFSPVEVLNFAAHYSRPICKSKQHQLKLKPSPSRERRKIRIGFISADFFAHATTHLMIEFLEHRDTVQFETTLYSYKKNLPVDSLSLRCKKACERFIDISELNDEDAARLVASDDLDLLVDVKGFNVEARLGILSYRPAPVILSWLAYPGTLGQPDLADYIIGDPIVTPLSDAHFYSEKILNLPVCYQPNKKWKPIPCNTSRSQAGLPEHALVFCSFNQTYKLTPQTFARWCSLIKEVSDSVLWMLEPKEEGAKPNLLAQWTRAGLAEERLIFAPRVGLEQHEQRIVLADIGLDTFPYTSHTTARDLFAVGVPLVALTGATFTSRVSASLLHFMGLDELVASNVKQWKKVNLKLAQNLAYRKKVKQRVLAAAQSSALFDPQAFSDAFYGLCARIKDKEFIARTPPDILYEDDAIRVLYQQGDGEELLVVFGDLIIQADRLNFPAYTHLSRNRVPVVAVMPKSGNWYPAPSIVAAQSHIERALEKKRITRRFLYGGSMGGYAAIRYSRLLGADGVLALVPQFTIDPEAFGGPTGYDSYYRPEGGGQPIVPNDVQGRIHLVYDPLHAMDTKHAHAIQAIADCHAIQLRGTGHHATTLLVRSGLFGEVLDAFRKGDNSKLRNVFKQTRSAAEWNAGLTLQLLFFRKPRVLFRLLSGYQRKQFLTSRPQSSVNPAPRLSGLMKALGDAHRVLLAPLTRISHRHGGVNQSHLAQLSRLCTTEIQQTLVHAMRCTDPFPQLDACMTVNGLTLVFNPFDYRVEIAREYTARRSFPVHLKATGANTVGLRVRTQGDKAYWLHVNQEMRVTLHEEVEQRWSKSSFGVRMEQASFALVHPELGPMRFDNTGALIAGGLYVGFFAETSL